MTSYLVTSNTILNDGNPACLPILLRNLRNSITERVRTVVNPTDPKSLHEYFDQIIDKLLGYILTHIGFNQESCREYYFTVLLFTHVLLNLSINLIHLFDELDECEVLRDLIVIHFSEFNQ